MANAEGDGPFPMKSSPKDRSELVSTVETVDARRVATNKVTIVINATGTTTTNFWKNPLLKPVKYVQAPTDGIWDFEFVADKPEASNDMITPIKATYDWGTPPPDVKEVRIIAKSNNRTAPVK